MDPYGMNGGMGGPPSGFGGAPPLPKPKRPKKPDPAARRMKHLDYVALMLGVDPPPPDADLPPPVGFRFPDPVLEEPSLMMGQPPIPVAHHLPPMLHTGNLPGGELPPPIAALPPTIGPVQAPPPPSGDPSYDAHILRMRGKLFPK